MNLGGTGWNWEELVGFGRNCVELGGNHVEPGGTSRNWKVVGLIWDKLGGSGRNWVEPGESGRNQVEPGVTG